MPMHGNPRDKAEAVRAPRAGRGMHARGRRGYRPLLLILCAYIALTCFMVLSSELPVCSDPPSHFQPIERHLQTDSETVSKGAGVGHLVVESAGISTWIAQPSPNQPPDWYLRHGIDGQPKRTGTPYLDARCTETRHLMVYGHNLGIPGLGFTSLARAFKANVFSEMGEATWSQQGRRMISFTPAFACRVDKAYETIQRFSFATADELRTWLHAVKKDATVAESDCDELIASARSALTLVTCTKNQRAGKERTLVIYVSPRESYSLGTSAESEESEEESSPSDISAS